MLTCWAVIMEEEQERREKGEGKEELSAFAWTPFFPNRSITRERYPQICP